ncbi:LysE family translocator [Robbsia sp. KACC 23696]|uniref:LysE family translocator n=1 Tax=Robbsia sp. KACC 23696 TaxID=3149231 RepID=UPI00325B72EF
MSTSLFSTHLLVAYSAYFVGTASPGPSNLAIMSIAATRGRKAAMAFALGVISGSMFWAVLAAVGLSAVLAAWAPMIVALKLLGGAYLLYLSYKSARSALKKGKAGQVDGNRGESVLRLYGRGASMHLTNPKALLVWTSIVTLSASDQGAPIASVIPGCVVIGFAVFGSYALIFSADNARRLYARARRGLEWALAGVFGLAGISLLASSTR